MTQCHLPWSADFLKFQPKFESYFQKTGSISQIALLLLCKEKGLETAAEQPFLNRQAFVCLQKPSKYYFKKKRKQSLFLPIRVTNQTFKVNSLDLKGF